MTYSEQRRMMEGMGEFPGCLPEPFGGLFMSLLAAEGFTPDQIRRCVEWTKILHPL